MKTNNIILISLFILITTTTVIAEEVKMAIGDWKPYTSERDNRSKLLEVIVTEAFKLENIKVQYSYHLWNESYINVRDGIHDGSFPWIKIESREKDFYYNKIPLIKDEAVFFHLKKTKFNWNTFEDLKKYRIGVTIGYREQELYKKYGINAEPVQKEEMNFERILLGMIDAYTTSKLVGYYMISSLFNPYEYSLFTYHPKVVFQNDYYVIFTKNIRGKMLADAFDRCLQKLKASGKYNEIFIQFIEHQ